MNQPECIKNFRQVKPWLYRGGHLSQEGASYLASLGVKTVLCLRWSPQAIRDEHRIVESMGMSFRSIPLHYFRFPNEAEISTFLSILDEQAGHPVYVHCKHGSDRTGLLLAVYRMARESWPADRAYEEMRSCGFHRIRMHHFKWALYLIAGEIRAGKY